jgi:hypothetical protein
MNLNFVLALIFMLGAPVIAILGFDHTWWQWLAVMNGILAIYVKVHGQGRYN